MNKNKRKLDKASDLIHKAYKVLDQINLNSEDKELLESIKTDLFWAIENCSLIGDHQIGKSLEDKAGE